MDDDFFIKKAIELSVENVKSGRGGPFGAMVVKKNEIIAEGWNTVTSSNDPTAHAEINAIRKACGVLGSFQLDGCVVYSSCEPCPMCLGALYWARPSKIFFSASRQDAAKAGFDDEWLYQELITNVAQRKIPTIHLQHSLSKKAFEDWAKKSDRIDY